MGRPAALVLIAMLASSARAQESAPAPASAPVSTAVPILDPPLPTLWQPSSPPHCYRDPPPRRARRARRGPRPRFCDGPRRVPIASDEALSRARSLGLGTERAAARLQLGPPREDWVDAVRSFSGDAQVRPLHWPADGARFWRGFGHVRPGARRRTPHRGVDLGAPAGTPIRAAADGLVVYADVGVRGYGNLAMLVHADGAVTFYAHARALHVTPGQLVRRGERIGEVGDTGRAHGTHLHFELREGGEAIDPSPFLVRPDAGPATPTAPSGEAPPLAPDGDRLRSGM